MEDVDRYIKQFPDDVKIKLEQMRNIIRKAAPDATEKMGYGIPTFTYHGNLVHFAGYKNHIGFYPSPSAIVAFKEGLKKYKQAKGSVQFPLTEPLPLDLITKIVGFRVKENEIKSSKSS